ncbi:MAG: hypothetical protein Ta2B_02220 [Termitinemataceae bacterium]|nr:MAG: hypothetical protein Ta2B_02220 [Termitinemataceae bacterium]
MILYKLPLTIPTYKCTQMLQDALTALLHNEEYKSYISEVSMFLDSQEPADINTAEQFMENLSAQFNIKTVCIAKPQKDEMIERLSQGDQKLQSALSFAFYGMQEFSAITGAGRNRNAQFLYYAGSSFFSADSDVEYKYWEYSDPQYINNIRGREYLNTPWAFFPFSKSGVDRFLGKGGSFFKKAKKKLQEYTGNPFADFSKMIGSTPNSSKIENKDYPAEKIHLVVSGIFGSRWFNGPGALVNGEPKLCLHTWTNKSDFEDALAEPHPLGLSPHLNILNELGDYHFVSTHFALNNSQLVPPTFAHCRGDDEMFSVLMRIIYQNFGIAYMPFAISHDPNTARPFPPEDEDDKTKISFSHETVTEFLLLSFNKQIDHSDKENVLPQLGNKLHRWISLDKDVRNKYYHDILKIARKSDLEDKKAKLAESGGKPDYWVEHLKKNLQESQEFLDSIDNVPLGDIKQFGDNAEPLMLKFVTNVADLLCVWTDLWNRAAEYKRSNANTEIVKSLLSTNAEIASYIEKHPLATFPYEWADKYKLSDIKVYTDDELKLKYVLHKPRLQKTGEQQAKKLYFKRDMSEAEIQKYYTNYLMSQDKHSPCAFLSDDFVLHEGETVVDIGAGCGAFSLEIIDTVGFIYIIECDPAWISALQATFLPWDDKVTIEPKYLSCTNAGTHITLDAFLQGGEVQFIKAAINSEDVVGKILKGATRTLSRNSALRLTLSAGVLDEAEQNCHLLASYGFSTKMLPGYMLLVDDLAKIGVPHLRHGVIRASNLVS